ncbi:MAG: magnesium transporter [Lutibacter sp.]|uniref:magnesium transporter n=1 Tax=Lutibacter sp. TaxID=1925666 RepID=UPI00299ED250|nr:magnesium transporter [Lutibacter sp.]MDX1829784.1 magnesium transporter [Lutibacter sp.]
MAFEINSHFLNDFKELIDANNSKEVKNLLEELHYADVAEIVDELDFNRALFVLNLLDSETTADILTELDDDTRERVLSSLSSKEIAENIEELETDDAADIINELSEEQKKEVISHIEDVEHAKDIVDLLRYKENSAGGLMAKEFIEVNENWTNLRCVKEMRKQAQELEKVHTIYVVDDDNKLIGILSLKNLLTTPAKTPIKEIYDDKVVAVKVDDRGEDIAQIMQKYDLVVLPVIDDLGVLVGQITIDDVVDFITEEAEKDYQMAAGISEDVDSDDSVLKLTRARLPWLLIGMVSGTFAASIITDFQTVMKTAPALIIFIPLINSSAGNVGVQSSAIVVQSIANKSFKGKLLTHIVKQLLIGLLNGLVMSLIVFGLSQFFFHTNLTISITIAIALVTVIINAAVIGTVVPIVLNKLKIDPAIATGPFVTTSNDIFGILIYFMVAKFMLGF